MVSNRKKHALRKNGQANVTLKPFYHPKLVEAGCDEAGRGCLAGPVFAAAVILPKDFYHPSLTDSKMLSESKRNELRDVIENKALSWAVYSIDNEKIDEINILKASVMAMHKAIEKLNIKPGLLLIDGNHFIPYKSIKHHCIIKGDGKYLSIAAASILAKTYRDDYMYRIHEEFPGYCWNKNKGYATRKHRMAIRESGITRYHRKSFQLLDNQLMIPFPK